MRHRKPMNVVYMDKILDKLHDEWCEETPLQMRQIMKRLWDLVKVIRWACGSLDGIGDGMYGRWLMQ